MTENLVAIAAADGKKIYGTCRTAPGRKRLVLHFHGLTHNKDGYLEILSAAEADKRGYDHVRVGFYERFPDARRLDAISLYDHVHDFRAVIEYFLPKYEKLFVSAHSFSGLVALIDGMAGVTAAGLWDPSTDVTHFWKAAGCLSPMPGGKQYRLDYGRVFIISRALADEVARYPDAVCLALAKKVAAPTQLVIPEQSIFAASPHASPKRYADILPGGAPLVALPGANHTFTGETDAARLLAACFDMFDSYV